MKFIVNLIRVIISIYLTALIFVALIFFSSEKYKSGYPSIKGYSFYIVEDDKLEPDIQKDSFVIIKKEEDGYTAKEGEYVLYKNGDSYTMKQVKKENPDEYTLDEYVIAYPKDDVSDYENIKKMDVIAKYYYHSSTLSICYKILTNWFVILILIIILVLSPSLTYKRFELVIKEGKGATFTDYDGKKLYVPMII